MLACLFVSPERPLKWQKFIILFFLFLIRYFYSCHGDVKWWSLRKSSKMLSTVIEIFRASVIQLSEKILIVLWVVKTWIILIMQQSIPDCLLEEQCKNPLCPFHILPFITSFEICLLIMRNWNLGVGKFSCNSSKRKKNYYS